MWPPEAVTNLKLAAHSGKTVNIRFKGAQNRKVPKMPKARPGAWVKLKIRFQLRQIVRKCCLTLISRSGPGLSNSVTFVIKNAAPCGAHEAHTPHKRWRYSKTIILGILDHLLF